MSDSWRADLEFRPDGGQLRAVGVVMRGEQVAVLSGDVQLVQRGRHLPPTCGTLQEVISGLVVGGHVMPQSTREASEI